MGILFRIGQIEALPPTQVDAPTNLQVMDALATSIQLTWDASLAGNTYQLQRATNNSFTVGVVTIFNGVGTGFTDTGLSVGATYYYRVRASLSGNYPSPYSNIVSGTTVPDITVGTPSNLRTSNYGSNFISLAWDVASGAITYILERATNSTFTQNLTTRYSGSSLSFNDAGLTSNTTYYYRVKAVNGSLQSPFSTSHSRTTSIIFSTTIHFNENNEGSSHYLYAVATESSEEVKFKFNGNSDTVGTPDFMQIFIATTLVMVVSFPSGYLSQPFCITDETGINHYGVITSEEINF